MICQGARNKSAAPVCIKKKVNEWIRCRRLQGSRRYECDCLYDFEAPAFHNPGKRGFSYFAELRVRVIGCGAAPNLEHPLDLTNTKRYSKESVRPVLVPERARMRSACFCMERARSVTHTGGAI